MYEYIQFTLWLMLTVLKDGVCSCVFVCRQIFETWKSLYGCSTHWGGLLTALFLKHSPPVASTHKSLSPLLLPPKYSSCPFWNTGPFSATRPSLIQNLTSCDCRDMICWFYFPLLLDAPEPPMRSHSGGSCSTSSTLDDYHRLLRGLLVSHLIS